jgi:hypothetical protein
VREIPCGCLTSNTAGDDRRQIVGSLASAQVACNPEKNLIGTIFSRSAREENRTFRYAPLATGFCGLRASNPSTRREAGPACAFASRVAQAEAVRTGVDGETNPILFKEPINQKAA